MNNLVSIIIPTFNHAAHIKEAILSVLNQSYKNFELIIVDDGSSDNTKDVVNSLISEKKDVNIEYRYQVNSGVSAARNKGIKHAKGECISFLDADDVYFSTFIEDMMSKINEGYDWVICDNYIKRINTKAKTYIKELQERDLDLKENYLKQMLIKDRIGTPDRMLIKKSVILNNNIFFDEQLACFEDWDFHIKLMTFDLKLGYVKKPLVTYRLRDDNTNSTRIMQWKWIDYKYMLLKKWKQEFKNCRINDCYSESMWGIARKYLKHTKFKWKAIMCMLESLSVSFYPVKKTIKNKFLKF